MQLRNASVGIRISCSAKHCHRDDVLSNSIRPCPCQRQLLDHPWQRPWYTVQRQKVYGSRQENRGKSDQSQQEMSAYLKQQEFIQSSHMPASYLKFKVLKIPALSKLWGSPQRCGWSWHRRLQLIGHRTRLRSCSCCEELCRDQVGRVSSMDVWVKIMDGRRTIVQISEMKVLRLLMADVTLLIWRLYPFCKEQANSRFFLGGGLPSCWIFSVISLLKFLRHHPYMEMTKKK